MGQKPRTLLVYSLTTLLFLVVATGGAAFLIVGKIQTGEAELRTRLLERMQSLERLRDAVYLSGALARDLFADPEGPEAGALRNRLFLLREEADRNTPQGELRAEVSAYWKVLDLMAEMGAHRHGPGVENYFRGQLSQRREAMLRITDQIAVRLKTERTLREAQITEMYGQFRRTLLVSVLVIVIAGAILAAVTIRRLANLERRSRALAVELVNAQEQERRAIARELHDEVGQSLAALRLDIAPMKTVAAAVERIIEEVRRIALSLRPSMLDDLGLVPALEWQAREVTAKSGVAVIFRANDSADEVPEAHRTCIYRIAQEALRNCARHSGANRVEVGLEKRAGMVSLQVEDNGKGFVPVRTFGLGLLGMKERVALLNGNLRITSDLGKGTSIRAELPL
jgi:signal transduction histidine kinase